MDIELKLVRVWFKSVMINMLKAFYSKYIYVCGSLTVVTVKFRCFLTVTLYFL